MQVLRSIALLLMSIAFYTSNGQGYKPPFFAEADRVEKITSTFPRLDSMLTEYAEKHHFPSLAFGLVVDGRLMHTFYAGEINLEKNIPAGRLSDYHIASMTKSITAMAVLKLRDEGKLSLDDPIDQYIPGAKNLRKLTSDAPLITIRDLLIHTAGFPEDNPWGDRQLGRSDAWLDSLYATGPAFSNVPGLGYEYSNLGYSSLGLIIKKVSGKTYQEYITEHIFKPIGMTQTYWDYEDVPESQLVIGYRYVDGKYVRQPLLKSGSFGAMGGLITTIEDFAKYMEVHLAAWPPRDGAETGPIKRSSVREMHYPWSFARTWTGEKNAYGKDCDILDFYGYGLHLYQNCEGLRIITHSGGLPGFGSQWRMLPDHGIALAVFGNRTYSPMGALLTAAIDSLIVWTGLKPRQLPPSDILEQRKKDLLTFLPDWKNATDSPVFAENFFGDNYLTDLKKNSEEAFKKAGHILSVSDVVPVNQLRGYFILKGEKQNLRVWFTLSPEPLPKIQAFRITVEEAPKG